MSLAKKVELMPKIVILGSCRFEPYEILAVPNKIPNSWNTEKGYKIAAKKFHPAIEKADCIIVYDPDGIGEHTQRDINYALSHGKDVIYLYGSMKNQILSNPKESRNSQVQPKGVTLSSCGLDNKEQK